MKNENGLLVRFWGVRGSTPTPEINKLAYGGNTTCIEVRSPSGQIFVIDGGSGLRNLGQALMTECGDRGPEINMLLTHFHWDHIQGIPFFSPLYRPDAKLNFFSSDALGPLQDKLLGQMSQPYFPVTFDRVAARREFSEFGQEQVKLGDVSIHPFFLNHPQGAVGYRIESNGKLVVHASDLEHGKESFDKVVRDHAQGADILIYDAQYTPEEYESHRGWGHSTWLEATKVARDAKVKQLILFHHDPWHDDAAIFDISRSARMFYENTIAAAEGWFAIL